MSVGDRMSEFISERDLVSVLRLYVFSLGALTLIVLPVALVVGVRIAFLLTPLVAFVLGLGLKFTVLSDRRAFGNADAEIDSLYRKIRVFQGKLDKHPDLIGEVLSLRVKLRGLQAKDGEWAHSRSELLSEVRSGEGFDMLAKARSLLRSEGT